jgi:hypothetical protein
MRYVFLKITFASVVIVLYASTGLGCTCGPVVSVLDEYDRSQVVIIARLVSVEKTRPDDKEEYWHGVRSSRFVVEKVYKGDVRAGDTLVFGQGNGLDCTWALAEEQIGQQSLVYLNVPPAGADWRASSCGRSKHRLKNATEDLLYLDKMDQVRGKTRVSGQYAAGLYRGELKVGGRTIRIVGETKTYETVTDENGVFEIYDLPPGNYRLEPEIQSGLILDLNWLWFSSGWIREQSTNTSVAFTLKPQKHESLTLGFKLKDEKPSPAN